MLYISRYIGPDQYGVVDTDDGVEQVISFTELYGAVCLDRLSIAGAPIVHNTLADKNIVVCQPPDTISRVQAKAKVLLKVDVKCYKSMITSIIWNRSSDEDLVDIRLSDYGTCVADYVLARNVAFGGYKVCLIFDDKLTYCTNAFRRRYFERDLIGKNGVGAVFDLRELSDGNAAILYDMLYSGAKDNIPGGIIDQAERMDKFTYNHYHKYLNGIKKSYDEFRHAMAEGIESALY